MTSRPEPAGERLQKVLARAGVASRRAAETLITEGRVEVNGETVTRLGVRVDPASDRVRVDGRPVRVPEAPTAYWAFHKPRGIVTTLSDPEGRKTIRDYLPNLSGRLFAVGRLDYHSEGLLLLTDDGDLARNLMHPSTEVPKRYLVKVRGCPSTSAIEQLRRGVVLDGRSCRPRGVWLRKRAPNAWVEIVVTEGRKHLVRRLLAAIGHPVSKLKRTKYGPIPLGTLPPGGARRLTPTEVRGLEAATRPSGRSRRPPRTSPRTP